MASITIIYADTPTAYELPTEVGAALIIGCAENCNIILPAEAGVSEQHCSITCFADGYALADLGSAAGTYANGNKLENEYMTEGSTYRIGAATLAYHPAQATAATPGPAATAAPATEAPAEETKAETTPAEQPTNEAPGEAPSPKKAEKKSAAARPKTLRTAGGASADRMRAAMATTAYNRNIQRVNYLYVAVVLLAAFYAGMALYSWQHTGNPLPIFLR